MYKIKRAAGQTDGSPCGLREGAGGFSAISHCFIDSLLKQFIPRLGWSRLTGIKSMKDADCLWLPYSVYKDVNYDFSAILWDSWVSMSIPGPIVDDTVILFKYLPFAADGLALTRAEIRALKLSTSCSVGKDTLPIGAWTIPAFSTRY
jgi:hypothetical protein